MSGFNNPPAAASQLPGSDVLDPQRSDDDLIVYTLSALIRIWRLTISDSLPDVTPCGAVCAAFATKA
jgi:hypothetical protein